MLEVGLFEAKQAAGREGDEDPVDPEAADDDGEPTAPDSLLTLRLKLEAKLAYIAKYMLGTPEHPTFLTVGSLKHDGYLSDLEARTATRVLSWRDEDFAQLSPAQAVGFLADADKVVRNMRAGVLQGMVRRDLKAQGWRVKEKRRGAGRRPDLIASRDGGARYRLAAVFVMASESDILERAKDRLAKRVEKDSDIRKHIVVVPDRSKSSTDDDSTENLQVVKLQNLGAAMAG